MSLCVRQKQRSKEFRKRERLDCCMNSEDRKRLRKQKHRIMMMRLWLPVVLVVVLVAGLTAGGIAMSLGQTKSVAEQGTKEAGTKENETKGTSNEPKETATRCLKSIGRLTFILLERIFFVSTPSTGQSC